MYFAPEGTAEPASILAAFFGCSYGSPRTFYLGEPHYGPTATSSEGGVEPKALVGTILAYEDIGLRQMIVRNLRNGRVLHRVPIGTSAGGRGEAHSVVLKTDGSVAWIAEFERKPMPPAIGLVTEYEVGAVDRTGTRVLAVATDIAPKSLALAGSTLYWTQRGAPMSTVLN